MSLYRKLLRPLLFGMDAERAHGLAIAACRAVGAFPPTRAALSAIHSRNDSRLQVDVCGLRFPNPIGLAAGFDKNGRAISALAALGFGHIEIGSISADPSEGNPRPRLWRLPEDRGLIVNYGLPNDGAVVVAERLSRLRRRVPLGINLVKTNRGANGPPENDDDVLADYVRSAGLLKDLADYLVLNLSCPNTETGRNFFAEPERVADLLGALGDVGIPCPVFLKVAPTGGVRAIEGLLEAVEGSPLVSGFIFNLPPGKPGEPRPGAVSGKPLEALTNQAIRELYCCMDHRRYAIIGAGGIFSAEDAYRKIRLGASLVQLVTGMVYEGPGIVKSISRGLSRLLDRDGLGNISEAVGTATEEGLA